MKKLLLILMFVSSSLSAQELVWQSYTKPGGDISYSIQFYSDEAREIISLINKKDNEISLILDRLSKNEKN